MPFTAETDILKNFQPITLEEMDEVKLMNRTDTKFVFNRKLLLPLLSDLKVGYKVLNVNGNLISTYNTLYYDTLDFDFYLNHHRGKENRYKVRIRNYVESGLFFLEIKNKYKGRTDKKRIRVSGFQPNLNASSVVFINAVIPSKPRLEAKLWNSFSRITLVNQLQKERLTLDLDLSFSWNGTELNHHKIVIAELKQENVNRHSLFYSLIKQHGVVPNSISKYCVGVVGLNPSIKYNNFKPKTLLINKLSSL